LLLGELIDLTEGINRDTNDSNSQTQLTKCKFKLLLTLAAICLSAANSASVKDPVRPAIAYPVTSFPADKQVKVASLGSGQLVTEDPVNPKWLKAARKKGGVVLDAKRPLAANLAS
jgi:hypothetical protein